MKARTIYMLLALVMLFASGAYAQQVDSIKRVRVSYLKQYLQTDTITARLVSDAQETYKSRLSQVMSDSTLTVQEKRSAMEKLVEEKNRKLEELLPAEKRVKVIPSTEMRRTWRRDSTAVNN